MVRATRIMLISASVHVLYSSGTLSRLKWVPVDLVSAPARRGLVPVAAADAAPPPAVAVPAAGPAIPGTTPPWEVLLLFACDPAPVAPAKPIGIAPPAIPALGVVRSRVADPADETLVPSPALLNRCAPGLVVPSEV